MKFRIFSLIFCFLFLFGCSNDGYENWYNAGYQDGYNAAMEELNSRTMPTSTPKPSSKLSSLLTPTSTPAPTQASDDFTVYVSRSGTMHLKENCSGMTHSTAMPYSVASQYYDKKCGNCFKKDPS